MPRSLQEFDAQHFHTRLGLGILAAIAVLLLLFLLKVLLPWLLVVVALGTGYVFWERQRQFQQRLHRCFYDCLRTHQGRISVLDFAMTAQITGPEARTFLDKRARDFCGEFEPLAHGDILYTFRTIERSLP
ncbi:MAG: hypothetical protein AAGH78_14630 [Cyanobacteria bacterium P01_H01_bin.58]